MHLEIIEHNCNVNEELHKIYLTKKINSRSIKEYGSSKHNNLVIPKVFSPNTPVTSSKKYSVKKKFFIDPNIYNEYRK